MKHIESSKLIMLAAPVDAGSIKYSLVERLRGAFHVETVGDGNENFSITAIGKDIPCRCTLSVLLKTDGHRARLIVDGDTEIKSSTKIFYALGVFALLILGTFPGMIKTTSSGSALDIMVFLFLGMFILYDVNRKLAEPERLLDRILRAVATEFGA